MPKKARELEAVEVRRLEKPGFHAVGAVAGLLLRISKAGARSWILRATVGDRRRDIGLGGFPDVTLAQARQKAREARAMIERGIDPAAERKRARDALRAQQETRRTFREVWREFWAKKSQELGHKARQSWQGSIESYALPVIGTLVVADIEMRHCEDVLRPIWNEKPMTAKKLRGRLEAVLSFATVKGYRSGDNPARWADNLKEVLPAPSKVHATEHFRALPIRDVPEFVASLQKRKGNAARALEFCILTAARSGEVRGARWEEIDFKRGRWIIPGERMKMGREHVVPLSNAALSILKNLPRDNELIFPAPRGGELSDMSLLGVVKRMGYKDRTTVHGFRSAFKDWTTEETDTPDAISEMALAHSVGDQVQQAYRRSDLVAKRLKLMREWSQYLGYSEAGAKLFKIEARK